MEAKFLDTRIETKPDHFENTVSISNSGWEDVR